MNTRHASQQFTEIARAAVLDRLAPYQGRRSRDIQALFGTARAADEYRWQCGWGCGKGRMTNETQADGQ